MKSRYNGNGASRRRRRSTLLVLLAGTAALALIGTATANDTAPDASTDEAPEVLVAHITVDLPTNKREGDDAHEKCAEWTSEGECENNPDYMAENCAASCAEADGGAEAAPPPEKKRGRASVYAGEDAAIGAFRFAEQYSAHYRHAVIPTSAVLDVARELQTSLPDDYAPPEDVTHCGDAKRRICSAGKLWKRAEEMRKDDMHDAAGADLIRALLRTGIETDFVERCERSLQWAFGSITRQRERERREAEEEAKLEKRRQAELEAMKEAEERKREYEADFVKFGKGLQEKGFSNAGEAVVGADGSVVEEMSEESKKLIASVIQTFIAEGPQGGNSGETLALIKKIPQSDKTVDILLIEARCHEMEGNHKQVLSAAGKLIAKAANHDPWINDSPRMMATTLGANSAMQLGLSENAISFYQNVLKFDPEQDRARKQYRGLKKVVKLMKKADEQIEKGYNNAASGFVDDCLSAMRGLDVDSPLFRSRIQLKQCTILSGMGKYEEALMNCDTAVELRLANADVVSEESRREAHLTRVEALLLDMDYDEAVSDLRAANELMPDDHEGKRELMHRIQQTQHQQSMWNGGEKDQRFNEHTGYPDGRPAQRDHAKILQLPIDLEQRSKEVKCAWLKKQFKKMVRQYHPDKYKGNKNRAARKFGEVKDAKEIISNQWKC